MRGCGDRERDRERKLILVDSPPQSFSFLGLKIRVCVVNWFFKNQIDENGSDRKTRPRLKHMGRRGEGVGVGVGIITVDLDSGLLHAGSNFALSFSTAIFRYVTGV